MQGQGADRAVDHAVTPAIGLDQHVVLVVACSDDLGAQEGVVLTVVAQLALGGFGRAVHQPGTQHRAAQLQVGHGTRRGGGRALVGAGQDPLGGL